MTKDIQLFAGITPLQGTLANLHAEIVSFIEKRFAAYDSSMEIPSREYFAEKIDDFLSTFSAAMSDCCTQLKGIARKVSKKLKVTLLNFYDYITRGLWLLRESPRCRESLEDFYFIPESFDVEGLKELIGDLRESFSYENLCEDVQLRTLLSSLRVNLLSDLERINCIIDGDMVGRGFAIRRWAAKFRSDVRNIRSIYEDKWERSIIPAEDESIADVLQELRDETKDNLEESDFYIEDFNNTNKLVASIHSMRDKATGEELDKFLYNYTLLEFLEERIKLLDVRNSKQSNVEINFYAPVTYDVSGNLNNYPNAKTVNNYGK